MESKYYLKKNNQYLETIHITSKNKETVALRKWTLKKEDALKLSLSKNLIENIIILNMNSQEELSIEIICEEKSEQ